MTAALALLMIAGATTFVPAEDIGLGAVQSDSTPWELSYGLRHVDVDGDGDTDIVREDAVFFLQDGKGAGSVPLPAPPGREPSVADFWKSDLYTWDPGLLRIHHWEAGAWQLRHTQTMPLREKDKLPDASEGSGDAETETERAIDFHPFLHDINGDDTPEILFVGPEGVSIFMRRNDEYSVVGLLEVLPPLRPVGWMSWNNDPGAPAFPPRQMECMVELHGSALTVIDNENLLTGDIDVRFHITRYQLRLDDAGVTAEKAGTTTTQPLPAFGGRMRPMRLNEDDAIDFVGHGWEGARSRGFSVPTGTTYASTDGGQTLQTLRMTGPSMGAFPDWDGDGDRDIITRSVDVFEGGLRELLTRAFTHKTVGQEIGVHLQDEHGRFSREPDVRWRGGVLLDAPPWKRSEFFFRYLSGEMVMFAEFNGDKRIDLGIQDRPDRFAIYFGGPSGYGAEPDLVIPTDAQTASFEVDIDGDGRHDLVFADLVSHKITRILLSREKQP